MGVDYFGARLYLATVGRMPSVDPLYTGAVQNPQRWNRYAYALNNPLRFRDPDGRSPDDCFAWWNTLVPWLSLPSWITYGCTNNASQNATDDAKESDGPMFYVSVVEEWVGDNVITAIDAAFGGSAQAPLVGTDIYIERETSWS